MNPSKIILCSYTQNFLKARCIRDTEAFLRHDSFESIALRLDILKMIMRILLRAKTELKIGIFSKFMIKGFYYRFFANC